MNPILRRILAYLIDCTISFSVIMLLFQWALLSNIRGSIGITEEWFKDGLNAELYVLLTISLPVWLYFIIMDSKKAKGTYGKRWMKLEVLNAQDSQRISIGKNFLRTMLKLAPWEIIHLGIMLPVPLPYAEDPEIRMLMILGSILFGLYFISILIDAKHQSIYDRLLGAAVISK